MEEELSRHQLAGSRRDWGMLHTQWLIADREGSQCIVQPPNCTAVPIPIPPDNGVVNVLEDDGWVLRVGNALNRKGAPIHEDNQILWRDHGTHSAP